MDEPVKNNSFSRAFMDEEEFMLVLGLTKSVSVKLPAGVKPLIKHMDGKHDQSSHGRRGNGLVEGWGDRQRSIDGAKFIGPTTDELDVLFAPRSSSDPQDYDPKELEEFLIEEYGYTEEDIEAVFSEYANDFGYRGDEMLNTYYQRLALAGRVGRDDLENDLSQWATKKGYHLGDGTPDDQEIFDVASKLMEVYGPVSVMDDAGDYVNLSPELEYYEFDASYGRPYLAVRGNITDEQGNWAGEWQRIIYKNDDGTYSAEKSLLQLEDSWQGKGFATQFDKNAEDYYIAHGFRSVKVHAALSTGGYAWAQAGYDWAEGSGGATGNIVGDLSRAVDRMPDGPMKGYGLGMVDRLRNFSNGDPEYPTPYEIANFGRTGFETGKSASWIGKNVMMGSDWYGEKMLTPTGMRVTSEAVKFKEYQDTEWHNMLTAQEDWANAEGRVSDNLFGW